MDSSLFLFIVLALAAGAAAGWFVGARQAAIYR